MPKIGNPSLFTICKFGVDIPRTEYKELKNRWKVSDKRLFENVIGILCTPKRFSLFKGIGGVIVTQEEIAIWTPGFGKYRRLRVRYKDIKGVKVVKDKEEKQLQILKKDGEKLLLSVNISGYEVFRYDFLEKVLKLLSE